MEQGAAIDTRYVYLPLVASQGPLEVSLLDYWRAVTRRKRLVLLLGVLFAGIAVLVFQIMKPAYVAEASMVYVRGDSDSSSKSSSSSSTSTGGDTEGGRESSATVSATGDSEEEAIAILKSRRFTDKFFDDYTLMPILFADQWDAERKEWKLDPGEKAPTMWDAYKLWDSKIRTVEKDRDAGVTLLSIRWADPKQAAEWTNVLVARLNSVLTARAIEYARRNLDYLNKTLKEVSFQEVREGLFGLVQAQISTMMVANMTDEYAYRVVDPAVVPQEPVWTLLWKALAIAAAAITGLMLGVFLAIFMDYLDRERARVSTPGTETTEVEPEVGPDAA